MDFALKYPIERLYLTAPSKRRSGRLANPIKFVVAHDTGNSGSTAAANVHYYERSRDVESASAHIFVDDATIANTRPQVGAPPSFSSAVIGEYESSVDILSVQVTWAFR